MCTPGRVGRGIGFCTAIGTNLAHGLPALAKITSAPAISRSSKCDRWISASIHLLPHHLHQIPPIPILQHRLGLALQLLGADPAGSEGHFLRAGHLQALALFQRGL